MIMTSVNSEPVSEENHEQGDSKDVFSNPHNRNGNVYADAIKRILLPELCGTPLV
jgi:hypothetical protein